MTVYRAILTSAWQVLRRRPWVWALGFFTAILIDNGGEYQLFLNSFDKVTDPQSNWWWPVATQSSAGGAASPVAVVFWVALGGLALWLMVSCLGALIVAADNISQGRAEDRAGCWRAAQRNFWKTLGLVIIGKGLTTILLMAAVLPLVLLVISGGGSATVATVAAITFILFVPLTLAISFATRYGIAYGLLHDQPFGHALFNGWKLFTRNWLISLEMAFLLFAISLGVGLLLLILSVVILTFLFAANTALATVQLPALLGDGGYVVLLALSVILIVPLVAIIGAGLGALQTSAWTILFRRLTNEGAVPKIVRWFRRTKGESAASVEAAFGTRRTQRGSRRR